LLQQPIFSSAMLIGFIRQRKDSGSREKQLSCMLSDILYYHQQMAMPLINIAKAIDAVDNNVVASNEDI
jgi:hypothetical protein